MLSRERMVICVLALLVGVLGCHAGTRSVSSAPSVVCSSWPATGFVPVPPPDSEPAEMYNAANLTTDSVHWSGQFVRDVVVVRFRPSATQAERQRAVENIHGIVVGGTVDERGDGLYLVRLCPDPTNERLFNAIGALRRMPQVLWAMPDWVLRGTGAVRLRSAARIPA